ncbi:hypothetical protein FRC02_009793 [Tulasnella sp. 418]|nr:hypothetical protein FRC02_009793 [Tulasnella sp. 418]
MSATVVADTPELVGLIIEQLQIVERPNTSTLAACMRVNSVFHLETGRYLWDTLKDMRGIYTLLPPDVVGHLVSDHPPELIPGPLPPSIWQRLERYSGFVKELSISTNADVKLLTFLMERCLDHPLFPNITSLTLATACGDQIVRSLLRPGLRKLELRLGFKPQASLLDALRTTRLTDLGLKRYNAFNHWLDLDVLSSAIQQNLKSLRLRYFWLSEAHLFLIDSISEIEHLYITMFAFKSTGQGRIVSSQVLLPKLSSL